MSTVWLVESGEYSDYHIAAIFSTEDQANEFAAHYDSDASVREYPLDTWTPAQTRYQFTFDLQGNITSSHEKAFPESAPDDDYVTVHRHTHGEISVSVNRGPRDHAVKIASEYYARVRARLDEADARVAAAYIAGRLKCRSDHGAWLAIGVAKILAGLDQLPIRENASMYGVDILEIFKSVTKESA